MGKTSINEGVVIEFKDTGEGDDIFLKFFVMFIRLYGSKAELVWNDSIFF